MCCVRAPPSNEPDKIPISVIPIIVLSRTITTVSRRDLLFDLWVPTRLLFQRRDPMYNVVAPIDQPRTVWSRKRSPNNQYVWRGGGIAYCRTQFKYSEEENKSPPGRDPVSVILTRVNSKKGEILPPCWIGHRFSLWVVEVHSCFPPFRSNYGHTFNADSHLGSIRMPKTIFLASLLHLSLWVCQFS